MSRGRLVLNEDGMESDEMAQDEDDGPTDSGASARGVHYMSGGVGIAEPQGVCHATNVQSSHR